MVSHRTMSTVSGDNIFRVRIMVVVVIEIAIVTIVLPLFRTTVLPKGCMGFPHRFVWHFPCHITCHSACPMWRAQCFLTQGPYPPLPSSCVLQRSDRSSRCNHIRRRSHRRSRDHNPGRSNNNRSISSSNGWIRTWSRRKAILRGGLQARRVQTKAAARRCAATEDDARPSARRP